MPEKESELPRQNPPNDYEEYFFLDVGNVDDGILFDFDFGIMDMRQIEHQHRSEARALPPHSERSFDATNRHMK